MRTHLFAASLAASVLLAACGGGSGSAPLPKATIAPSKQTSGNATFVVKIPPKRSSSARTPKYLTADVQGIEFDVTQNNGSVSAGYVFYPISSAQPYCTTPSGGGLTCTLAVQAIPGDDTFAVKTYDQPNNGFNADVISTGSVEKTISTQSSNTVSVVTSGIPSAFVMSLDDQYPAAAGTQAVHLLALDADMNVIVGSYDTPVTLSDSDTSGITTLSAASVANSTDAGNVTLTWNGTPTINWATLLATTNSPLAQTYNNTLQGRSLVLPGGAGVLASPTYLVFANSKDTAQTITLSAAGAATAPFQANTNADGFGDWGLVANDSEASVFIQGCSGIVTVSGSSPTFTVTPAHAGFCNLNIRDSSGTRYGTVPIAVQSL